MNANLSETPASDSQAHPLAQLTVADFATTGILSVQPDAPIQEVARLMASNGVHAVAVVDDAAPEPPVIRDVDLVAAAARGNYQQICARDIAGTQGAISVSGDERLDRAAQLLAQHGATHLVIRDHRRVPAGILSTLDIARAISRRGATSPR